MKTSAKHFGLAVAP